MLFTNEVFKMENPNENVAIDMQDVSPKDKIEVPENLFDQLSIESDNPKDSLNKLEVIKEEIEDIKEGLKKEVVTERAIKHYKKDRDLHLEKDGKWHYAASEYGKLKGEQVGQGLQNKINDYVEKYNTGSGKVATNEEVTKRTGDFILEIVAKLNGIKEEITAWKQSKIEGIANPDSKEWSLTEENIQHETQKLRQGIKNIEDALFNDLDPTAFVTFILKKIGIKMDEAAIKEEASKIGERMKKNYDLSPLEFIIMHLYNQIQQGKVVTKYSGSGFKKTATYAAITPYFFVGACIFLVAIESGLVGYGGEKSEYIKNMDIKLLGAGSVGSFFSMGATAFRAWFVNLIEKSILDSASSSTLQRMKNLAKMHIIESRGVKRIQSTGPLYQTLKKDGEILTEALKPSSMQWDSPAFWSLSVTTLFRVYTSSATGAVDASAIVGKYLKWFTPENVIKNHGWTNFWHTSVSLFLPVGAISLFAWRFSYYGEKEFGKMKTTEESMKHLSHEEDPLWEAAEPPENRPSYFQRIYNCCPSFWSKGEEKERPQESIGDEEENKPLLMDKQ